MTAAHEIESLLARAEQGDVLAFQRLFVLHHARLRELAQRKISPAVAARLAPEDLLQQTYLRALEARRSFENRGPEAFFHWIERILAGGLVDAERALRALKRDVGREVGLPEATSAFALLGSGAVDSATPSRIAANRESEGLVLAALAGLSQDHRTALDLRYLKGLTLAEVGAAMGRTPAAVQMLCARAAKALRDSIATLSAAG